ncbi:MAG: ATP-dependent DNA helicase [Kineosporiaceae bacterium]
MSRAARRVGDEQLSLDMLSVEAAPREAAPRTPVPGPRQHRLSARDIARELGRPAPTDEQVAVIEAPVEPLLVVAGAGSGKTETMAARVVWLVANGLVLPEQVLGLTFTRKAAGELAERIRARLRALHRRQLIAEPAPVAVSTYHSYAAAVVRDHGLRLGIEPTATVLGEAGAWQLVDELVGSWDGDMGDVENARSTVVDAVLTLASECAEHLVRPADVGAFLDELLEHVTGLPAALGDAAPGKPVAAVAKVLREKVVPRRRLVALLEAYAQRKRERDVVDFGDQVALAARLARDVPEVAEAERRRFPVVLLDEYQDTSHAQLVLLRALFGDGHAVTAVGDPHQSIYGWRGASAGTLERFPEQFPGPDGVPALVRHLSTSWRNDHAVLDAANALAAPLRAPAPWSGAEAAPVQVLPLGARPDAGAGQVRVEWHDTVEDELRSLADTVEAAWTGRGPGGRGPGGGSGASVAVLCRTRSLFPAVEAALRGRGLPVEVVGLGGLLHQPEVAELRAALEVVHDPSRGDSLMRLLTGAAWQIGAADLEALSAWSSQQAARHRRGASDAPTEPTPEPVVEAFADAAAPGAQGSPPPPADQADGGESGEPVELDAVDERSLVEAVDDLPGELWQGPAGQRLSDEGRRRLRRLGDVLRGLRARTLLPLPDLVVEAERALLLDVEVASRPGVPAALARAHLDAFVEVAAGFAASSDDRRGGGFGSSGLGAFLGWLQAAAERERGLEGGAGASDGAAVQVLTVHAAKGLEWDVVAVPGLTEGCFPSGPQGRPATASKGWLADLGALPYPLRGDVDGLPPWRWRNASSQADLGLRWEEFVQGCTEHDLAEERRLAYVAVTRARHTALLSGAVWGEAKSPRPPSRFLVELRELALPVAEPEAVAEPGAGPDGGHPPVVGTWADPPGEGAQNPRLRSTNALTWPLDPLGGRRDVVEDAAQRVRRHLGGDASADPVAEQDPDGPEAAWAREVDVLLAERDAGRQARLEVELPAHLSASQLVALARDASALAARLRRPMPQPPSPQARRGSAFHAWLERRFASAALVDVDDLPGAADDADPVPASDDDLPALQASFLASEWASRIPDAVEVAIETPVGPVTLRGRIDAVFGEDPDEQGRPRWTVVDWKTGAAPSGPGEERARAVQLAVYRLAWARLQGVDVSQVGAAFFYAGSGRTHRPVDVLDEAGLVAVVEAAISEPAPAAASALPQRRRRR